jgi:hypothetical protein
MVKAILNDSGTVWCTTFYGGVQRGTCYDFVMVLDDRSQVQSTLTHKELEHLLFERGHVYPITTPDFANQGESNG